MAETPTQGVIGTDPRAKKIMEGFRLYHIYMFSKEGHQLTVDCVTEII